MKIENRAAAAPRFPLLARACPHALVPYLNDCSILFPLLTRPRRSAYLRVSIRALASGEFESEIYIHISRAVMSAPGHEHGRERERERITGSKTESVKRFSSVRGMDYKEEREGERDLLLARGIMRCRWDLIIVWIFRRIMVICWELFHSCGLREMLKINYEKEAGV